MILGAVAIVVSIVSLLFTVRSWRESHRPLVTARVTSVDSGNVGIPLNLVVENTGNRPAKNLRLMVDNAVLENAFAPNIPPHHRTEILACFEEKFVIPVLANGAEVSNSFGYLSWDQNSAWRFHSRIPLRIEYQSLEGRRFWHEMDLFVADNSGFASSHWSKKPKKSVA